MSEATTKKASIRIIEGQQGSGKTTTAVAIVVDAYKANPNTKIFANFHLYGIKYVLAHISTIIEYLNSDLITDGYVIIDESYIGGDARQSSNLIVQVMTWFGSQIRKRQVHLILIAQHGKMIDWRYRYFATDHVICLYNEDTNYVTTTITGKGNRKERTTAFWSPQYWKYFNTLELPQIPEAALAKALSKAK